MAAALVHTGLETQPSATWTILNALLSVGVMAGMVVWIFTTRFSSTAIVYGSIVVWVYLAAAFVFLGFALGQTMGARWGSEVHIQMALGLLGLQVLLPGLLVRRSRPWLVQLIRILVRLLIAAGLGSIVLPWIARGRMDAFCWNGIWLLWLFSTVVLGVTLWLVHQHTYGSDGAR